MTEDQLMRRWPWPDPRRRFRDRLMMAMLAVALIPLAAFATIVVVTLGTASRSTAAEARRSIVEDEIARLQAQAADEARLVDIRLSAIASEVRQLRDQVAGAATAPPGAGPALTRYGGLFISGDGADQPSSLVIGGPAPTPAEASARAARLAGAGVAMVPVMAGVRRSYPEIQSVWALDRTNFALRAVPGFDAEAAADEHHLKPADVLGGDGDATLAASQARMASPETGRRVWADPRGSDRPRGGPFWTDPHAARSTGAAVVSVWMPVGDGDVVVGADVSPLQLSDSVLSTNSSDRMGSASVLVSSSNRIIAADDALTRDLRLPPDPVGTPLSLPRGDLASTIVGVERTGAAARLQARLGGADRLVFSAPIYTARWVLAQTVPASRIEPDAGGLSRGIGNGIAHILLAGIPVALTLCGVAFAVASVLARRLVGPVGALTEAAARLAQGRTDEPVPPQGEDEVGVLAKSLERMRQEINRSRDTILAGARELEGRVGRRTAQLRVRNDELVALNELAGSLSRSLEPGDVLRVGLDAVRAILPLRSGGGFLTETGQLVPGALVLVPTPPAGAAEEPMLLEAAAAAVADGGVIQHPSDPGILVGLGLPSSRGCLGALALHADVPELTSRRTALLQAVAQQVGLALCTAQLSAEERDSAVLEERTRLAREIHDTLAQQLTAVVVELEAAEALADRDGTGARHAVEVARDMARAALQEARRSVWDLRPSPLGATGVVAALAAEMARWEARTGIRVRLSAEGLRPPLELSPEAEVALLRISQEALANIARHSGAGRVLVSLDHSEKALEMRIEDDGCGFAPGERRLGSFGLVGMAERARLAGGALRVDTAAGRGTRLAVSLPLRHEIDAVPV